MHRFHPILLASLTGALASCGFPMPNAVDDAARGDGAPHDASPDAQVTPTLTLLGGKPGGRGIVDGLGTSARLAPVGITSDNNGSLYVTELSTIRRFNIATTEVTTVAGAAGNRMGDGTGSDAGFFFITGATLDGTGNLFVSDDGPGLVRKIALHDGNATGVVTTFAGQSFSSTPADGIGTNARFVSPWGMATDGAGNLYVNDSADFTVRKIVLSSAAVSTIAGAADVKGASDGAGANARFNFPSGMAYDGSGNLFIVDGQNFTIRKLVLASGAVTTFAGTAGQQGTTDAEAANARFEAPQGIAIGDNGLIYVTDGTTVRTIDPGNANVITIAGVAGVMGTTDGSGSNARFTNSIGLTFTNHALYIADESGAIRAIPTGVGIQPGVITVAGSYGAPGSADGDAMGSRFSLPNGVVTDDTGNIYVADTGNHTVRRIAASSGAVSTIIGLAGTSGAADGGDGAGRLHSAQGVAYDGQGNLFIADTQNHTIRKFVLATGALTTFAGSLTSGRADGIGSAAGLGSPSAIVNGGDGNLYFIDQQVVRELTLSNQMVTTVAGSQGSFGSADGSGSAARFESLTGVAADGAGNVYVADQEACTVKKLVLATSAVTTIAGSPSQCRSVDGTGSTALFAGPTELVADGHGNLYISDVNVIRKLVLPTGVVTTVVGSKFVQGVVTGSLPGGLNQAHGVAVTPSGGLVIVDHADNSIVGLNVQP